MVPIIKAEGLSHTYNPDMPYAVEAIRDISFEMEPHSFLGIIGPTGCGKSTLITHFNGLLKPTEGTLYIDGEEMWEKPKEIRKFRFLTGLVFQYPEYQLFEETVAKDIAFGPKNMRLTPEEVEERVYWAANFVDLSEKVLQSSPFDLSGGQKRRAAIAGVLAMRPKLLVLDEPAAGLDPDGRDRILEQIRRFHEETGTSVVLVSHSMEDVAKYADKVLVMKDGGIAMYDDTPTVFSHSDKLIDMGLDVPQITRIFLRLKAMGLPIPTDAYTIEQAAETIVNFAKERKQSHD